MEEKTMMPINNQIEPDFLEHMPWSGADCKGLYLMP